MPWPIRAHRRPIRSRAMRVSRHWPRSWRGCAASWPTRSPIWPPRCAGSWVSMPRCVRPDRSTPTAPAPNISTASPMSSRATPSAPIPIWPACWPTSMPPRWWRTGCRPPRWVWPPGGCRSSPCTPPKAWSGRSWRSRTCRRGCSPPRGWRAPGSTMPASCRLCCAATPDCTASRCSTPPQSTTVRRWRPSSTPTAISWRSAAMTRSADCSTSR